MNSFPDENPTRNLTRLASRRHDVLIIGGGINGAGLARDLALRGLSVALVEQGDFASGTSSASTKLIHGGLRYLQRFDFRLVFESCCERHILQQIAPHLVRPLPFLIPVYRGDPHPLLQVRAGLTLYDLLAVGRSPGRHRILNPRRAQAQEPALRPEGLRGAALYWDCRMDDARLCLENVLSACEAGAEAASYLEAVGLLKRAGKIGGARLRDRESGTELEVEAEIVVNAAGPWLDRICALDGESRGKLRPTRGSHILVPRINRGGEALYMTAGRDDRLFFVLPWNDLSIIGTTDVDDLGDPGAVIATEADIDYLLTETARHLQGFAPARSEVVSAFAGIRPLVADNGGSTSGVSREHRFFTSPGGMISIGGGKYTTYRAVAAEAAQLVAARLGRGGGPSRTATLPLPGGAADTASQPDREIPRLADRYGLEAHRIEALFARYGARVPRVLAMLDREPALAGPVAPGSSLLSVEVAWAIDNELARAPEDILRRRTPLALLPGRGGAELDGVIGLMAKRLGATGEQQARWRRDYVARHLGEESSARMPDHGT